MSNHERIYEIEERIYIIDERVDKICNRGFISVEDALMRELIVDELMDEREELFEEKQRLEKSL